MVKITIEETENPNIRKFCSEHTLVRGALSLNRDSDISEIPLAQDLFQLPYVEKIYVNDNYVAVAKDGSTAWNDDVLNLLRNTIIDSLLEYPMIFVPKKKSQYSLYIEMTANPNVMKFVCNRVLVPGKTEVNRTATDVGIKPEDVPLAEAIFNNLEYVQKVEVEDNMLFLTRNRKATWGDVMLETRDFISGYLQGGNPINKEQQAARELTGDEKKIKEVIAKYITPSQGKGERFMLDEYIPETKTAMMLLKGDWDDCVSCRESVRSGIEFIFKKYLPELIEQVETVKE